MELQQLRYFLAVASEKNITRTAEHLRLSQPALSRQIHQLEDSLGGPLFERSQGGVTLTERGYYLAEHAKEMVRLADKISANLNTATPVSGELYIGGGETRTLTSVITTFKQMKQLHPDIKLRLYSGNGDDVIDKLDRGILDFGVVIEPVNLAAYASRELPHVDRWGVLTRRDSQIGNRTHLETADLLDLPLILSEQSLVDRHLSDRLSVDLGEADVVATYNLLYNASLLVHAGIGHALCLDGIINTNGTELVFVPLNPSLTSSVHLIWKNESHLSNVASTFLDMFDEREKTT
ncbi:LysR family transcriptional regulator [Exiguobacterium sp. SH1S21]|uniref:LysR family transcriptional regulator n=1 Tax=Exiguobacterium sp. SH1S21 TaxID=2510953 RepID=UPI00103B1B08|nr:LysR family transcriptional regulator [Exiguobacterium sp. SH1S21]TCI57490.1 LysR family transcriptional regulator [Exiguobacterium sp. SH1S21]